MVVFCDLFSMFVRHDQNNSHVNFLYSKQSLDAPCFHRGFLFSVYQKPIFQVTRKVFDLNIVRDTFLLNFKLVRSKSAIIGLTTD